MNMSQIFELTKTRLPTSVLENIDVEAAVTERNLRNVWDCLVQAERELGNCENWLDENDWLSGMMNREQMVETWGEKVREISLVQDEVLRIAKIMGHDILTCAEHEAQVMPQ